MDKNYDFNEFESRISEQWISSPGETPYTIVMPPPNVTGSLHLGHALSSTLQDILIRFQRMRGFEVLWVPGTDHAGIATQMMVEKQLAKEGHTRQELGREAFLKRIWAWKEKYAYIIIDQMKRLGFSANWSYLSFTLDPPISQGVNEAFCRLYQKGLIYRAQRLVNWDPQLKTALSDLEVVPTLEKGFLWTLHYPVKDRPGQTISVATTRPETLFGDQAIAVHPDDERYENYIGQTVLLPLTGRVIPIIADRAVDPTKGTGAVKITPAHDFLDFEIGQRHSLSSVTIFDEEGRLNQEVPLTFQGLDRFVAREKVLEALGEVPREEIEHTVPYSDRSGVPVEPRLTLQWFVDTKSMADKAVQAVKEGQTVFVPHEWAANYFEWLKEIRPWCISRQLWWGHRIPAWYGPEDSVFVASNEEEALRMAQDHFGYEVALSQDEDVLDTWFSSGLWPFTTLGWPKSTPNLQHHYPTDVLVTGFDIIFFWVARMMMLSLEMTGKVPFRTVYIHPLIRDEQGKKMSKTKRNVIDPLDLIDQYGADALRFALVSGCVGRQYMRFGLSNVEHARNFMTKIWNVARFLSFHQALTLKEPRAWAHPLAQWFAGELQTLIHKVTEGLKAYRFQETAFALHHFTWHIFCDRFVEFAKDAFCHEAHSERTEEVRTLLAWSFQVLLRLLHPFVPFITERLWEFLGEKTGLYQSPWPEVEEGFLPSNEAKEVEWSLEVMNAVRRLRASFSLSPKVPLQAYLYNLSPAQKSFLTQYGETLKRLLSLEQLKGSEGDVAAQGACIPLGGTTLVVPLAHLVDIEAEKTRLIKEAHQKDKEIHALKVRLSNPDFHTHAPDEVIHDLERRLSDYELAFDHLKRALAALGDDPLFP